MEFSVTYNILGEGPELDMLGGLKGSHMLIVNVIPFVKKK